MGSLIYLVGFSLWFVCALGGWKGGECLGWLVEREAQSNDRYVRRRHSFTYDVAGYIFNRLRCCDCLDVKKAVRRAFYLFTLKSDFQLLVIEMTIIFHEHRHDELRRRALGLGAKVEIERNQKRIRRIRSLAELFLIVSLATVSVLPFSWINVGVALAGFIMFVVVTWSSFHFFIESLLPYFVAIKYSAGELTDIRTSFSDTLPK